MQRGCFELAIFKIIHFASDDNLKLLERLNYIREPYATQSDLIFGEYVSTRYPYEEMMLVKQCYLSDKNNTFQGKHFFEYVISLREEESTYLADFKDCVAKIDKMLANYNAGHFQVISAIHLNTDNLHAHIIANNTDWQTGTRFNLFKSDFFAIREQIDTILKEKFFSSLEIKQ